MKNNKKALFIVLAIVLSLVVWLVGYATAFKRHAVVAEETEVESAPAFSLSDMEGYWLQFTEESYNKILVQFEIPEDSHDETTLNKLSVSVPQAGKGIIDVEEFRLSATLEDIVYREQFNYIEFTYRPVGYMDRSNVWKIYPGTDSNFLSMNYVDHVIGRYKSVQYLKLPTKDGVPYIELEGDDDLNDYVAKKTGIIIKPLGY